MHAGTKGKKKKEEKKKILTDWQRSFFFLGESFFFGVCFFRVLLNWFRVIAHSEEERFFLFFWYRLSSLSVTCSVELKSYLEQMQDLCSV